MTNVDTKLDGGGICALCDITEVSNFNFLGCEQSACCCSYQVGQMVESHREAVFPSRGLLVVLDHRPQVPLPHCSPEEDLGLKADVGQLMGTYSAGKCVPRDVQNPTWLS